MLAKNPMPGIPIRWRRMRHPGRWKQPLQGFGPGRRRQKRKWRTDPPQMPRMRRSLHPSEPHPPPSRRTLHRTRRLRIRRMCRMLRRFARPRPGFLAESHSERCRPPPSRAWSRESHAQPPIRFRQRSSDLCPFETVLTTKPPTSTVQPCRAIGPCMAVGPCKATVIQSFVRGARIM